MEEVAGSRNVCESTVSLIPMRAPEKSSAGTLSSSRVSNTFLYHKGRGRYVSRFVWRRAGKQPAAAVAC